MAWFCVRVQSRCGKESGEFVGRSAQVYCSALIREACDAMLSTQSVQILTVNQCCQRILCNKYAMQSLIRLKLTNCPRPVIGCTVWTACLRAEPNPFERKPGGTIRPASGLFIKMNCRQWCDAAHSDYCSMNTTLSIQSAVWHTDRQLERASDMGRVEERGRERDREGRVH